MGWFRCRRAVAPAFVFCHRATGNLSKEDTFSLIEGASTIQAEPTWLTAVLHPFTAVVFFLSAAVLFFYDQGVLNFEGKKVEASLSRRLTMGVLAVGLLILLANLFL
ncbi:MAG: hypothetical protein IMW91_09970 [Firmicutes bacterium]|nr:hypothetical protein [Bacillota bacterium]